MKITTKMISIFSVIVLLTILKSFGQKIDIGQDANQVQQIVEMTSRDRMGYDTHGRSKGNNVGWDVKYFDGAISEVVQCFYKQYLADIRLFANYCKYYIMKDNKLAHIVTQYEDVSVSELEEFYNKSAQSKKIEKLYFSDDYTYYSTIYLHDNGLATVELHKTKPQNLSKSILTKVNAELKKFNELKNQRDLEAYNESQNKRDIISKVYDIKQYSPDKYNKVVENLRKSLKKFFSDRESYYGAENFPSFTTIEKSNNKYARFTNVYRVSYTTEDHSRESKNYGNVIVAGSKDVKILKDIELINGTDTELKLFKYVSVYLPTLEVKGYEVMTEVHFNPLKVDFSRGITRIKIKNGDVEFKKFPPERDLQQIIINHLRSKKEGTYIVKYQISDILGEVDVEIEVE